MTRRERLMAVFKGEPVDRVPIKLWRADPGQELLHPAYEPVYRLAIERSDLVAGANSPFDLLCGTRYKQLVGQGEVPTASKEWVDEVVTVHTPDGPLRRVYRKSTCKKPGYEMEYLLKQPEDIGKILSIPYEPYPFDPEPYLQKDKEIGDAGIVIYGLDHAMYGLQRLIGSENFALWSLDCRDGLLEAIAVFAQRIREHVRGVFASGLRPVFGWVGPELCIPPLMSLRDFDEFVYQFDKPLGDLIHEGGGYVWVHCHGKMGPVLERFVEMGVDVLNPVEPPPMGDITLEEAFRRVGSRMALEGNIETHELMTADPDRLVELVHNAISSGSRDDRRLILCTSSSYLEDPNPTDRHIRNLLLYLEEGIRFAESCARP